MEMIQLIQEQTIQENTHHLSHIQSLMKENGRLEDQDTFAVIGATIADNFGITMPEERSEHLY